MIIHYLQNSYDKYGKESFSFSVIDDTALNQEELTELEDYYMLKAGFPNSDKCYNMQTAGGIPSRCYDIYAKQDEICSDYQSDMTTVEIQKKYNIGLTFLYSILRMNNIPTGIKGKRLDLYDRVS